jgi:hypothetical protein
MMPTSIQLRKHSQPNKKAHMKLHVQLEHPRLSSRAITCTSRWNREGVVGGRKAGLNGGGRLSMNREMRKKRAKIPLLWSNYYRFQLLTEY